MTCKGSLSVFDCQSRVCQNCNEFDECRERIVSLYLKIGKKKLSKKIMAYKRKMTATVRIPEIEESLPVVVKQKLYAIYKRGFCYTVGQTKNPFTEEDPISYSVIYRHLFNKKRMSKMDIRTAIMEDLGWGNASAKVEVSKIIAVMTVLGIAKMDGNVLRFLSLNE